MEGELKHFSHEKHPLILATQLQQDDQKPIHSSVCYGCQKPILEEPTYKCSECNIFLHKTCAELPREMLHHPLHLDHPLKLLPNSPYPKDRSCLCDACRQPWNSFVYHCYRCNFDLDILCAFPQGKLEHPSHEHLLTLVQRIASFACDACGTKEEQQSYICTACTFWIHRSCALLPTINHRKPHQHPLSLAYCFPIEYRRYEIPCDICFKKIPFQNWLYYCGPCRYFVHLKCMTNDRILPLYTFDVKCALLPSTIDHKAHEHSLVQTYRGDGNKCNSCGNVVRSFLYACEPCGFYLNYECALLPESVNHRWDKHTLPLSFPPFSDRPDEFYCEICEEEIHPRRWHYHCRECDQSFHPRCIPGLGVTRNCNFGRILEFGRHPHPLKLVREGEYRSTCDSCHERMYGNRVFKCETCQFYICIKCVARVADSGKVVGPAKISEWCV
ncbi:uncharacterized protein [Coffea arabica]|uniref:Phorbol-ester/DAG-type domain-containing protein n=1 Tax=Coffea arabica TaxID=13443 RepID=A0ABM4UXW7_COFAR